MWLSKLSGWQLQIFNTFVHYLPSLCCNHICASARHVAVCQNFKHGDWLSFYGLILTCLFWAVSNMQHMDTFSQLLKPGAFFYTFQLTLPSPGPSLGLTHGLTGSNDRLKCCLNCRFASCPFALAVLACPGFSALVLLQVAEETETPLNQGLEAFLCRCRCILSSNHHNTLQMNINKKEPHGLHSCFWRGDKHFTSMARGPGVAYHAPEYCVHTAKRREL